MNPFRPPSAPVDDPVRPKGSILKAMAVGLLVDIGGTTIFGVVLAVAYAAVMSGEGQSAQQIQSALADPGSHSWVFVIGMIGGTAFSIVGGYVCERIARRGNYNVGLALGVASTVVGLITGGAAESLAMTVLLALATIVAVLIGTHMAFEKRRT